MAAGVSIRLNSVLGFIYLLVPLVGVSALKGTSYTVEDGVQENVLTLLEFREHAHSSLSHVVHHRNRRDQPPPTSTSTSTPPSPTTPSSPTPTSTTTTTTSSTATSTSSTQQTSTTTTTTTTTPPPPTTTSTTTPSSTTSSTSTSTTTTETTTSPTTSNQSTAPVSPGSTTIPTVEEVKEDNHTYYQSEFVKGDDAKLYWVDLDSDKWPKSTHLTLSDSHRTAATVQLKFTFLFYGHEVKQVTIATGGFLYMSSFLHQWLTATQYCAPLMANFDTKIGNDSSNIHYADNGTAFVVQWENVHLQDMESVGPFNFQVILMEGGKILFVYKQIPMVIDDIPSDNHPVKVGLSDAYYVDQQINKDVRRRTIYEYHRVSVKKSQIASNTAYIILPNPTCITLQDCESCTSAHLDFDCKWCSDLDRCSDGLDRMRQEWLEADCHKVDSSSSQCSGNNKEGHGAGTNVGAVIAIILVIFALLCIVIWFVYAYKNPHTASGMWLIEHRPNMLKAKLSKVKFWKSNTSGDKYEVSMQPEGDSVA